MKGGPHIAHYEAQQGLPLIVGPFVDYDTAWRYVEGPNVDDHLYSRAWVAPLTAPIADAEYPLAKLPGQRQACGCDQAGTTSVEQDEASTLLCGRCAQFYGFSHESGEFFT